MDSSAVGNQIANEQKEPEQDEEEGEITEVNNSDCKFVENLSNN